MTDNVETDNSLANSKSSSKREKFAKSVDFVFACCGSCIGFGNVWKFPFLCYKNGGGAFLLPYILACLIIGLPIFLLEAAVGQFMSSAGMGAWKICPLFQGIGLATTVIVFLQACTYNIILAWVFYYFFSSFTTQLPWSDCNNGWNTDKCMDYLMSDNVSKTIQELGGNFTNMTWMNTTHTNGDQGKMDPVTEFWERKVLGVSDGIEHLGGIKWDLCLCLLLCWLVVYFVIWKGIKVSGKVLYVTVIAPYVLMIILLIRGVTLDGAVDGIKYYISPNITQLGRLQVWTDAGYQVTFSYGLGIGMPTVFGSYNKFHHKSYRDCFVYAGMNTFTSLLSGFIIFSVLGFMSKQQGVPISDVAESGPGLAFIAYPEAVAQLPGAPFWAVVFFLMLVLLGIDSDFGTVETFITAAIDMFPRVLKIKHGREMFVGVVCAGAFIISLPMVTEWLAGNILVMWSLVVKKDYGPNTRPREDFLFEKGGVYVFLLVDFYVVNNTLFIVILLETIVVSYVYGVDRFLDNLEMMYGARMNVFKLCWAVLSPISVAALLTFGIITYTELTYEGKSTVYYYPDYCRVIGWVLTSSSVLCIPVIAAYKLWTTEGGIKQRIQITLRPDLQKHQLRPGKDTELISYNGGSVCDNLI